MNSQTNNLTGAGVAYAEVTVATYNPTSSKETFTYSIPGHSQNDVVPGQLVWVPLRKNVEPGIVIELHDRQPDFALRKIYAVAGPSSRLNPEQLNLAKWLARETACGLFAAAAPFLPPGATHSTVDVIKLSSKEESIRSDLSRAQQQLVDFLLERGEVALPDARNAMGKPLTSVIPALVKKGVLERTRR
jgi:primosomal protein N'